VHGRELDGERAQPGDELLVLADDDTDSGRDVGSVFRP
jgi:hypothetical protein